MEHKTIKIGVFEVEYNITEYMERVIQLSRESGMSAEVCQRLIDSKIEIEQVMEQQGFTEDVDAIKYIEYYKHELLMTKQHKDIER